MKALDSRVLQLLRETLEGVLAPNVAASLLFEALGDWDKAQPPAPSDHEAFVRGPLLARLIKRVGASEAASISDQILERLAATQRAAAPAAPAAAAAPGAPRVLRKAPTFADRSAMDRATTPIRLWELPVIVIVVSCRPAFAQRLGMALGPDRVAAVTVAGAVSFRDACQPIMPGVVVVDANAAPAMPAAELAVLLASLPPSVVRALWRSETDYGQELTSSAERVGVAITPLFADGDDRIAPLCDMIRSMRQPPADGSGDAT